MKHPFLNNNFKINWSELKPEHVVPDIEDALKSAGANIEEISGIPDNEVTFLNTIVALENSTEALNEAWSKVMHLDSVSNSKELREAINTMLPRVTEFYSKIPLNEKLWNKIKIFSKTEEYYKLEGTDKRLFDETEAFFIESGANLDKENKNEFFKIQSELAKLTQKFSENVLDSTNAFELVIDDETKLKGLTETAKEQARLKAEKKSRAEKDRPEWLFTLHAPSLIPVLKYLDDENIRKQMFEAQREVGLKDKYDNTDLIWKILDLRSKKAELLGFNNFADLVLKRRMAGNGFKALDFINNFHEKIIKNFKNENMELEKYRAAKLNTGTESLELWDRAYWSEKMRQEMYDFNEEELRPYFPIDNVIRGMFFISEKLFSIKIEEEKNIENKYLWHPEVKYYNVYDNKNRHIGSFYTDWHPRSSKRSGAWMDKLRSGGPDKNEKLKPHIGLICGNLTPSAGDKPAMLTHMEVQTIFHEFGHLLHQLFGEVKYSSLNGTNVAWDFVELPSQIMENWCWERESLDIFAKHYKTGERIPEELFSKMIKARNFQSALFFMRQLSFSKMDLELHINYKKYKIKDIDELIEDILKEYNTPCKTKYPGIIRQFNHLFSSGTGYAAGYYSYKWAEVLDADAFTKFKENGILNPETGKAFREYILKKGNSEKAEKLFRDFMGRDADVTSLLKRSGLG